MTFEELESNLVNNGYEGVTIFEDPDYADAFIGVSENNKAIYDFDKMVEFLMEREMSQEDAIDFIEYDTIRSLPYMPNAPIVMYPILSRD